MTIRLACVLALCIGCKKEVISDSNTGNGVASVAKITEKLAPEETVEPIAAQKTVVARSRHFCCPAALYGMLPVVEVSKECLPDFAAEPATASDCELHAAWWEDQMDGRTKSPWATAERWNPNHETYYGKNLPVATGEVRQLPTKTKLNSSLLEDDGPVLEILRDTLEDSSVFAEARRLADSKFPVIYLAANASLALSEIEPVRRLLKGKPLRILV